MSAVSPEFDPIKDATNIRKHGVSLSEGDGVLNDPFALTVEDDSAEGEQRFNTIGTNVFWDPDGSGPHTSSGRIANHLGAETRSKGATKL